MDHTQMKENISALFDDELTGALKVEAQAHLASCAECQAFTRNWSGLSAKLFRPMPAPVSETFVADVMKRLEPARPRLVMPVQWFAPAMGLAAAFVFAVLPTAEAMSTDALLGVDSTTQNDDVLSFVMGAK